MVQKYSFAFTSRDKIGLVVALFLSLIPIFFYLLGKFHPVILIFPCIGILVSLFIFLKAGKTAIELSEYGIKFHFILQCLNIFAFSKIPRFVKWEDIQGMVSFNYHPAGEIEEETKVVKIFLKKAEGDIQCVFLMPNLLQRANELIYALKNRLTNITNKDDIFRDIFQNLVSSSNIQYKNWNLTDKGVEHSQGIIPWNDIKVIGYYGNVIIISYQKQTGHLEYININPKGTNHFKNFLRYLIKNSNNASVDPSILRFFGKSYKRERIFLVSALLLAILMLIILFIRFITFIK